MKWGSTNAGMGLPPRHCVLTAQPPTHSRPPSMPHGCRRRCTAQAQEKHGAVIRRCPTVHAEAVSSHLHRRPHRPCPGSMLLAHLAAGAGGFVHPVPLSAAPAAPLGAGGAALRAGSACAAGLVKPPPIAAARVVAAGRVVGAGQAAGNLAGSRLAQAGLLAQSEASFAKLRGKQVAAGAPIQNSRRTRLPEQLPCIKRQPQTPLPCTELAWHLSARPSAQSSQPCAVHGTQLLLAASHVRAPSPQ